MRVSFGSQYVGFTRNLSDIQERRNREQIKLQTGKELIDLSDSPEKIVDVKFFDAKIKQNENHLENLDLAISELFAVDQALLSMSEIMDDIRIEAIDSANERPDATVVLAEKFEGYLNDVVRLANSDFDGKFMFGGTKTTQNSLADQNGDGLNTPFEIIQGDPTADNPSGLSVVFNGNNDNRIINKDQKTTQVINQKAEDIFGSQLETFDLIIKIHNRLKFNDNGEIRGSEDIFTISDLAEIDVLQKDMANRTEQMNLVAGRNGTTIDRLQVLYEQITDETIRLEDYRALRADADVAKATINLQREETALSYALQVGARINQTSLFDFLR
jgi:flagellar hook-associated protein 3 FlgL